jgi:hypothetical protein
MKGAWNMRSIRYLQRYVVFIIICVLLVSTSHVTSAQQTQTITANGTIGEGFDSYLLTMTFPPSGGVVTGTASYKGISFLSLTGSFAGGDGGQASGTFILDMEEWGTAAGSWNGNFFANGTGSGTLVAESGTAPEGWSLDLNTEQQPWQVTFSAQEFQAAMAPVITSQYIYDTYGIRVEDSFGDDGWDQKAWTDRELILLNEVLKELPPAMIENMALTRIVRNKVRVDENGDPKPFANGGYQSCDVAIDPDCTGASATIRIYDNALNPTLFPDDPNGYKKFKYTILHELGHALEYHKDEHSIYKNAYSAPLMQNFMDATRPINDITNPGFWMGYNGWQQNLMGSWTFTGALGNQAATDYAKINPKEDLSESIARYVYDPQSLQNSSIQRYNFVRDHIFGGVEYENGVQKQP